jgi:alpha-beta hydrolase superfamily lysophospholipase
MKLLNPDLPILLIAGTEDPVGDQGKGVEALFSFLNEYVHSVEIVLLEGFRHEILNEVDKNKTYEEIIRFIQK